MWPLCKRNFFWVQRSQWEMMPVEIMCLLSSSMVEKKSCMLAASCGSSIKCKLTAAVCIKTWSLDFLIETV